MRSGIEGSCHSERQPTDAHNTRQTMEAIAEKRVKHQHHITRTKSSFLSFTFFQVKFKWNFRNVE